MIPKIRLVQAKTILTKSGLPGSDWVINPYNGCLFGCMYCYAAQIARWKHPDEVWGTYVDVKENAPEILHSELEKLHKKTGTKDFGSIFFSSVTDPYVGVEAKYHKTRQCLEVLADFGYMGSISLQTKSPLVSGDIDVLKKLHNVQIGFTVTTLDDAVSRFLEVGAPPVSARIAALKTLHDAGISTYAFVGPLLPHAINTPEKITQLLDTLEDVGVHEVWFEHINLSPKIKERLFTYLQKNSPDLIADFDHANTQAYRDQLDSMIWVAMKGRKITMGLGKVIHHQSLPKKK